jgi:hypothetical protein
MRGPAGYGRYDEDPQTVGCPWAKTDMTPCLARDGSITLSSGQHRVCVGCGNAPDFLIADLAQEYEPARNYVSRDPERDADAFRDMVRRATDPLADATVAQLPEDRREQLYAELADVEHRAAELRHQIVSAPDRVKPRLMTEAREDIEAMRTALFRAEQLVTLTPIRINLKPD